MTTPASAECEIGVAMQVWSLPDTVAVGEKFALHVGVKSAAGHKLSGGTIHMRDGAGMRVASARLHAQPWPQSHALYWAEVILTAPPHEGPCNWTACFTPLETLDPPHARVSYDIALVVAAPAAHTLTITVVDAVTEKPIETAVVRWGAYRASTDAQGLAALKVAPGQNELIVWKAGFAAPVQNIVVDANIARIVAVTSIAEEDPDSLWKM